MSKPVTCGVIVPVKAKPEHAAEFEAFLTNDCIADIKTEKETIHWFSAKNEGGDGTDFGLFDTFTGEEGRAAHMTAAVATNLMSHGDWYSAPPNIMRFELIAAKSGGQGYTGTKAGVEVGLRVFIKAKADKVDAVREFLKGALPLVDAEPATIHWAAIHIEGTNIFGIVDSFPDEAGRQAHLEGKVAEALFANVETLLEGPPDVKFTTILAGNIN